MEGNRANLVLGAIVGLLMGLAWCYYSQLKAAYENRGAISAGANLVSAGQAFWGEIKQKL